MLQNGRFDLTVIGGGPGGYVAAIRAAQLGMKVALVEKDKLGGVCLNIGCIPTKALLKNAEVLTLFQKASEFGISFENLKADFGHAIKRSQRVAQRLSKGVEFLMKKNQVTVYSGEGRLLSSKKAGVISDGKATAEVESERLLLATGSRPKMIPGLQADGKRVLTSDDALVLREAPRSIAIIGAGAVGVEFADIFHAYGVEVTLIEMLPRILPFEDAEISELLTKAFAKKGIKVLAGTKVEDAKVGADVVSLRLLRDGKAEEVKAEAVLVAVGRAPNTEGIGLEEVGVALDQGGFIQVDEQLRTPVPTIFAIGDCMGAPLLAHKAMHEGVLAVEGMAGHETEKPDPKRVPSCTYCHPQVASIGLTEAEAKEKGLTIRVGKFPYQASGLAQAIAETEGLVKVISDEETGEILGMHIIGQNATELIPEAGLAMLLEATPEELGRVMHPHPTLSEALGEAALAALGRAIHI